MATSDQVEPQPAATAGLRQAPRQERARRTIARILDVSESIIVQEGVEGVTGYRVAAEASLSVGRLYYWFGDPASIVEAVEQRIETELADLYRQVLADDVNVSTADLLERFIAAIVGFVDRHPATPELLTYGLGRRSASGQRLNVMIRELAAGLVELRVDGIPAAERDLVADTCVRLMTSMLTAIRDAPSVRRPAIQAELRYVLMAYLSGRYPDADSPVWTDRSRLIRPSRPARESYPGAQEVFPGNPE